MNISAASKNHKNEGLLNIDVCSNGLVHRGRIFRISVSFSASPLVESIFEGASGSDGGASLIKVAALRELEQCKLPEDFYTGLVIAVSCFHPTGGELGVDSDKYIDWRTITDKTTPCQDNTHAKALHLHLRKELSVVKANKVFEIRAFFPSGRTRPNLSKNTYLDVSVFYFPMFNDFMSTRNITPYFYDKKSVYLRLRSKNRSATKSKKTTTTSLSSKPSTSTTNTSIKQRIKIQSGNHRSRKKRRHRHRTKPRSSSSSSSSDDDNLLHRASSLDGVHHNHQHHNPQQQATDKLFASSGIFPTTTSLPSNIILSAAAQSNNNMRSRRRRATSDIGGAPPIAPRGVSHTSSPLSMHQWLRDQKSSNTSSAAVTPASVLKEHRQRRRSGQKIRSGSWTGHRSVQKNRSGSWTGHRSRYDNPSGPERQRHSPYHSPYRQSPSSSPPRTTSPSAGNMHRPTRRRSSSFHQQKQQQHYTAVVAGRRQQQQPPVMLGEMKKPSSSGDVISDVFGSQHWVNNQTNVTTSVDKKASIQSIRSSSAHSTFENWESQQFSPVHSNTHQSVDVSKLNPAQLLGGMEDDSDHEIINLLSATHIKSNSPYHQSQEPDLLSIPLFTDKKKISPRTQTDQMLFPVDGEHGSIPAGSWGDLSDML